MEKTVRDHNWIFKIWEKNRMVFLNYLKTIMWDQKVEVERCTRYEENDSIRYIFIIDVHLMLIFLNPSNTVKVKLQWSILKTSINYESYLGMNSEKYLWNYTKR